jgi:hypothetical protein
MILEPDQTLKVLWYIWQGFLGRMGFFRRMILAGETFRVFFSSIDDFEVQGFGLRVGTETQLIPEQAHKELVMLNGRCPVS